MASIGLPVTKQRENFADTFLLAVAAVEILRTRTLTKLYNERPAWLDRAHRELDAAVAAAYGWPADISDDNALGNLFALNQERVHGRDG